MKRIDEIAARAPSEGAMIAARVILVPFIMLGVTDQQVEDARTSDICQADESERAI
jgi:hypothetical protein